MADLAASDVTVTINDRRIEGDRRYNDVTIAFGDGALELPTTGVPLPSISSFGMERFLDSINLYQPADSAGYTWFVDTANSVIKISGKVSVKGAPAAVSIRGVARGY
jgi:hypothetical protein